MKATHDDVRAGDVVRCKKRGDRKFVVRDVGGGRIILAIGEGEHAALLRLSNERFDEDGFTVVQRTRWE